jgi:hypothetical protein
MNRFLISALMLLTGAQTQIHATVIETKEVYINLSDVFVPSETKSSGESYVVISGMFQNGCYSWNRAEVTHKNDFEHEIKVVANVSQGMCIMVLVPYSKEVMLGKLIQGEHTLRFINGDNTYFERPMNIP